MTILGARGAPAAGPLEVNGAGTPLVWVTQPVPFNPDRGTLGMLSNASAVALVAGNFGVWEAVPSSSIAFTNAGQLAVDVKVGNYTQFLSQCDGLSPIIFDDDGSITDDLLGVGAKNQILGFASPECGDAAAGTITESVAVLNGRWIDGVDTAANPEIPLADFAAVFVHEFGHFFNLDHSQIGRDEAFDGDPSNDDAVATMFPFLVSGGGAATLAQDDIVSVSMLYPAPGFAAATGTIRGEVLRASGVPFQGAYVIARNIADPRHLAVGFTSGARFVPLVGGLPNPGGPPPDVLRGAYELPGLPPGSYTVEIEAVDARFTGGSSVGPLDPPAHLPAPAEFWNGTDEAATAPPDDPSVAVPIALAAGDLVEGIDVVLNEPTVSNDACAGAVVIPGIPFTDVRSAMNATTALDDPVQTCTLQGPSQNLASLWYVFTAPEAGRLVFETAGSDYDTVASAFKGTCGQLAVFGCSDDRPTTVQSRLDLDVSAGTTLRFEVTAFHDTTPGMLHVSLRRGCIVGAGACDDGDPCTAADACSDGVCLGPIGTCDDGNPCTVDRCEGAGTCSHDAADGACDDGDVCSLGDACQASACASGQRIDAVGLATRLRGTLPAGCTFGFARLEQMASRRFVQAARAIAHGASAAARRRGVAFNHAARSLRGARRVATRLQRRGAEACGSSLAGAVDVARAQLDCVRSDLAR